MPIAAVRNMLEEAVELSPYIVDYCHNMSGSTPDNSMKPPFCICGQCSSLSKSNRCCNTKPCVKFDPKFTRTMFPDVIEICGILNKAKTNVHEEVHNCEYRAHVYALYVYWQMSMGNECCAPPNCVISFIKQIYVECTSGDHECDSESETPSLYSDPL